MRWSAQGETKAGSLTQLFFTRDGSTTGMRERLEASRSYSGRKDVLWVWALMWLCHCEAAARLQLLAPASSGDADAQGAGAEGARGQGGSGAGAEGAASRGAGGGRTHAKSSGGGGGSGGSGDDSCRGGFFVSVVSYERLMCQPLAVVRQLMADLALPLPPSGSSEDVAMENELLGVLETNSQAGTGMSSR